MIKGVIFDFNGTLFEDSHIHEEVWIQFFKDKLNYDMSLEEFHLRVFARDNNAIIKDLFKIDDLDEIHQLSEEKEEVYRNICRKLDIDLVKGARNFFNYLKENKIPFTIATGANISNVDFYFEEFELFKWFDRQKVICDDGYLPGKPDPTIYKLASEMICVEPKNCIVIEDSWTGVKAAKSAGVQEIYVLTDKDSFNEKVSGCIHDYDELMEKLCLKQND